MKEKITIAVEKEQTQRKDVSDVWRCVLSVEEVLSGQGYSVDIMAVTKNDFRDIRSFKKRILDAQAGIFFNLFEGFSDDVEKEADFVEILEDLDILYTGNSSYTLRMCLNKQKAKDILAAQGLPVPIGFTVRAAADLDPWHMIYPLFIKPCGEDASVGIDGDSLVVTRQELDAVIKNKLKQFPAGLIVEEFISGKEYSSAYLGNDPYDYLGASVIDYASHIHLSPFLTYASKWDTESQEYKQIVPSLKGAMGEEVEERIFTLSLDVARVLRCRGYFRIDLRERNGQMFILDVNPNPDINIDSGFIKEALARGYSYKFVIAKLIELARMPSCEGSGRRAAL